MTTSDNTPARGYSWKPFAPGHTESLRHGAYSPRKVDPLAADIVEATRPHVTWWRPADETAVWAWARTEARIQLTSEWLAERGGDLDDGGIQPAADLLNRLEARAESMRSRLGLEPLSRARLGRDVAAQTLDLARLWAQEAQEAAARGAEGSSSAAGDAAPSVPPQRPKDDDASA